MFVPASCYTYATLVSNESFWALFCASGAYYDNVVLRSLEGIYSAYPDVLQFWGSCEHAA